MWQISPLAEWQHETPQKNGHCITNNICERTSYAYVTYNYTNIYTSYIHTYISDWTCRFHQGCTLHRFFHSLPSLASPSWGCPTATKRCKFRPVGSPAVPRVSTRAQVRVVKLAIIGSECIKNWDEYTRAMKKSRGPFLSMSHPGCLKTGSLYWFIIIPI